MEGCFFEPIKSDEAVSRKRLIFSLSANRASTFASRQSVSVNPAYNDPVSELIPGMTP
jgi:hypothetical protein